MTKQKVIMTNEDDNTYLADLTTISSKQPTAYARVPLDVMKERRVSNHNKRIVQRLFNALKQKPANKQVRTAHERLDATVGIVDAERGVSLKLLERKSDYIEDSLVSSWL